MIFGFPRKNTNISRPKTRGVTRLQMKNSDHQIRRLGYKL